MSKMKLGQLVTTRGIFERTLTDPEFAAYVNSCMRRYVRSDWSDLCEDDRKSNELALLNGDDRILASYLLPDEDDKIWIITEWDHSVTTILFASEY